MRATRPYLHLLVAGLTEGGAGAGRPGTPVTVTRQ